MTEKVQFEVGDVVRALNGYKGGHIKLPQQDEYTVVRIGASRFTKNLFLGVDTDGETGWSPAHFELVRRASESQREGGFAVGQRVRAKATAAIHKGRSGAVTTHIIGEHWAVLFDGDPATDSCSMGEHELELEPADPAPALTHCKRCNIENDGHYVQLDPEGLCGYCVADLMNSGTQVTPPQPAPMTRAARVRAGMMADPYDQQRHRDGLPPQDRQRWETDEMSINEAARLRMARMSLDRPLDAEQARWEKLVGPCHPITGRVSR